MNFWNLTCKYLLYMRQNCNRVPFICSKSEPPHFSLTYFWKRDYLVCHSVIHIYPQAVSKYRSHRIQRYHSIRKFYLILYNWVKLHSFLSNRSFHFVLTHTNPGSWNRPLASNHVIAHFLLRKSVLTHIVYPNNKHCRFWGASID